jgi:hypothetical protein
MNITSQMKKLTVLVTSLAVISSNSFAGLFSTCWNMGDTNVVWTYCQPGSPTQCILSECTGEKWWAGSSCIVSLNPCSGCVYSGSGLTPVWEYFGTCTYSTNWFGLASCSCNPTFVPTNLELPVGLCLQYSCADLIN